MHSLRGGGGHQGGALGVSSGLKDGGGEEEDNTPVISLQLLSDDLLQRIFLFCGGSATGRVANTCPSMRLVASGDILWGTLYCDAFGALETLNNGSIGGTKILESEACSTILNVDKTWYERFVCRFRTNYNWSKGIVQTLQLRGHSGTVSSSSRPILCYLDI